ncbi:endonuclease/exonuclease/phosphatase family protein [Flexivirga sp. B27]
MHWIDTSVPRLTQLAAFTPLGTPFALIALLGGLVLVFVHRTQQRAAAALAGLSAILLGFHIAWLAPLYVGSQPGTTGRPVIVLSQNFEYGDPASLAQVIRTQHVDVLVLTDIDAGRVRALAATGVLRDLPYSVGTKPGQTISSVFFSRLPIDSVRRGPHSSHADLVRLHAPSLGDVDLVAVHPQPPYTTRWRPDYHALTSYLRRAIPRPDQQPTIIAGDFNATTDNVPFRSVLDMGYSDAMTQRRHGFQPTWPDSATRRYLGIPVPRLVTIDHILLSDTLAASSASTVHVKGADHRGVLAHIAQRSR